MKKRQWAFLFGVAMVSVVVALTACEGGGSSSDDEDSPVVPPATDTTPETATVRDIWEGDVDISMYTSESTPILVSPGDGFMNAQVISAASDAPVTSIIVSTLNGAPSANGNGWNFTMKGSAAINSPWVISTENPNRRSLKVHIKVWYSSL